MYDKTILNYLCIKYSIKIENSYEISFILNLKTN